MKFKDKLKDCYCVIGKCNRNQLPHIISCTIGIESERLAKAYSKQMSKMKMMDGDQRRNQYEWTKPMKLHYALNDKEILIAPTDKYFLNQPYKPFYG